MSTKENNINKTHSHFMRLALIQAQKNIGNTKENPSVGCVIVKNKTIIGVGSTSFNGRPHAEINAINNCKSSIKNSELFSTLEPCTHYGKTPPCINTIIKKKIKKVIFGIADPDIRTFNKSTLFLKKKKINVKSKVLSNDINKFYKSYLMSKKKQLPFVTAKLAFSKDYYTKSTKEKWITNNLSRARVHLLRSSHDAIVTSATTILNDNARLTCRINGLEKFSPSRFILDKDLKTPLNSHILKNAYKFSTTIFYNKNNKKKINTLIKMKVKLIKLPLLNNRKFDLQKILYEIKDLGFSRILVESGINLTKNFLIENLINEFYIFVSSKKLGSFGKLNFKYYTKIIKKNKKIVQNVYLAGDKMIRIVIK